MNCDAARIDMIPYLKGALDNHRKRQFEEHLAGCAHCRSELDTARRVLSWTEAASDESVVKKVETIFNTAIKASASDIHFEPQRDNGLRVRMRVDGVMHELEQIDSAQRSGIIARLKMLADVNVSEERIPQDGRVAWKLDGADLDLRVSCVPIVFGESIVIRILDRSCATIGTDRLGFYDDHMATIRHLLSQPCGMIYVTGPTGSGKTTTLYSLLHEVNSPQVKVMTVEDPVEYLIPGANQTQVQSKVGLTFASVLRAFMRQDPDVILVGEMRDMETLKTSIEAALTGHLVMTSIHSDNVASSIQRLRDTGVEDYLLGASLLGIVSQRLVRKACSQCRTEVELYPNSPIARGLGITAQDAATHRGVRGTGCDHCRNTGYRGRAAVYEVFQADGELAALISEGASTESIIEAAKAKGFTSMREDARRKMLDGVTSAEEAFRVLASNLPGY